MQKLLDPTDPIDPPYGETYPTLNDFDFMENLFSTMPQDHLANLPEIHETPPENDPAPASNSKPTQSQRPLLPRTASEPAHVPMMYSALPNSYHDSLMNGEQINDINQRLMTIQNTAPTFRQMSDLLARVTGMETRLAGMETRKTNLDTRQTSIENRQATIETKLSIIERQSEE
jgi:hypothetical protein